MDVEKIFIKDAYVLEPKVYEDERGNFYESYSQRTFKDLGLNLSLVQDNESYNKKSGTIRGLHFQIKEMAQAKLIRVSQGSIYGVCVDLRKNSPTYKKYFGICLSGDNHKQLFVPKGCAWGFQTLTDNTIVCYKLDNLYDGSYERGLIYSDPELNIDWPIKDGIIISNKDKNQVKLENLVIDILLIGVHGQLGHDVYELLKNSKFYVNAPTREELNICDTNEVNEYIEKNKPDVIINCAAYTNVENAESEDKTLCYDINVNGTKNLVQAAKKVDAKFVYISSDYIFDGNKDGVYHEEDIANPNNYYGLTKLLGEEITRTYHKHFIIRTSWLFGVSGKNFVKSMITLAQKQKEVSVVDDQIGSPTYTKDLAKLILDMITTNKYGTYNVTNSGYCSWNEFAHNIFNTFHFNMKVKKVTTKDFKKQTNQKANRPLNSKLSNHKLKNQFYPLPTWQDALERYKNELDENESKNCN